MSGSIVLIGPMGAGKTSIGRRVAKSLGVSFHDTDAAIVREHGPIGELFVAHGEEHFREIERSFVAVGLTRGGVVALGGGSVLHPETQRDLAQHSVVLLKVGPKAIAARLHGSKRPLLADDDPVARWNEIYQSRRALYESLADVEFDTSSGPLKNVVEDIANWVRNREQDTV